MHLPPVLSPVSITPFLSCSEVISCTNGKVRSMARSVTISDTDDIERARSLFLWVRDNIAHSVDSGHHEILWNASEVLESGHGLCFGKTHLFVAFCRSLGIPAGMCYQRVMKDDQSWVLHGLAAVFLEPIGRWIRLDPRGNKPGITTEFSVDNEKIAYEPHQSGEWLDQHIYAEPWQDLARLVEVSTSSDEFIKGTGEIRSPPVRHDRNASEKLISCSS